MFSGIGTRGRSWFRWHGSASRVLQSGPRARSPATRVRIVGVMLCLAGATPLARTLSRRCPPYSPIAASIGGQRSFQGAAASYAAEARSTN